MKTETNYNIDDLLVKSLLDEATEAEQMEINQWLSDSDDNQRYFEHFELIWMQSKRLAAHSNVDEEAAWKRFKKRTQTLKEETPVIPLYPKPAYNFLRVAAMLFVTACVGWIAYVLLAPGSSEQLVISSGARTLIDTLPDGSIVTLNRKSTISYPAHFTGHTRQVTLTGEAFFDVTPDKGKPFIISVNDVTVRVVGTSFNVKDNAKKTEVIVETGLVEVAKNDYTVKISPREKATVIKSKPEVVRQNVEDQFYNYYRTGKLVCEDTPLWKLVEILNETYEAHIVIENDRIKDLIINTTFDQRSLDSTLSIVGETLTIKVERNGELIILK
jgi:ferric-dicitrate binding protein FerR (iron transport regulator)